MELADRIERRLKLHDLRVLMTVVQAGSMGKAAKQLGTSQPAISRAISDLEHMLGVPLLDRDSRGVEATTFGRLVISRGVTVFDELRQTVSDIEFLSDPAAGEVRIATSIAAAVSFVSAIIDRLSKQYARLSFDVLSTDNITARRALEERRVDLTIGHLIEPVADSMNTEILFHEPHVVLTGSRSPLLRRRNLRLKDLINERWMLPPTDSPFESVVLEAFRAEGIRPSPRRRQIAAATTHFAARHQPISLDGAADRSRRCRQTDIQASAVVAAEDAQALWRRHREESLAQPASRAFHRLRSQASGNRREVS